MWNPLRNRRKKISFSQMQALYLFAFFLSLHSFIPTYANSTFLETFLSAQTVGVVFAGAALFSLIVILNLPRLLRRLGVFKLVLLLIALEIATLLTLGLSSSAWITVIAFIMHLLLARSLLYTVDIFTESLSTKGKMGSIRGMLLTTINTALLISPLLVGFIIGETEAFRKMYLASALLLIPAAILLLRNFRNFKDPNYQPVKTRETVARIFKNKDLFNVFAAQFLLRFFYAWMIIYTPIYLIETIGFSWTDIGPIFTVMLLPFIIFELPLGRIADEYLGEKELLIAGFVVVAISTFSLSFITTPSVIVWMSILFLTRLGASMVEIMSETYFFKKISPSDTELVALFRTLSSIAFIAAPVVTTLTLIFIDIRYSFMVLAAIMLTGIVYAAGIYDTK